MSDIWLYSKETGELYHYGRKGMKWYQNIFTSAKNAIKKRRAAKAEEKVAKKAYEERKKLYEKAKKNPAKYKTSEELQKAIEHMRLEKEYNQLMADTTRVSGGKAFAKKFANEAIIPAATTAGKNVLTKVFEKAGMKIFGLEGTNEVKDELAGLKKEAEKWKLKRQINENKKPFGEDFESVNKRKAKEEAEKQAKWEAKQDAKKERYDKASEAYNNAKQRAKTYAEDRYAQARARNDQRRQAAADFIKRKYEEARARRANRNQNNNSEDDYIYDGSTQSAGVDYVAGFLSSSPQLLLPGS